MFRGDEVLENYENVAWEKMAEDIVLDNVLFESYKYYEELEEVIELQCFTIKTYE